MVQETFGGRHDVMVNNAGVQLGKTIADTSDEDWEWLSGINMRGNFFCTRAAVRLMRQSGGGVILNIGSVVGEVADNGLTIYSASKAWIHGLTRAVTTDQRSDGIRCTAICPSWTMTELSVELFEQEPDPERAGQSHVLPRIVSPPLAEPGEGGIKRAVRSNGGEDRYGGKRYIIEPVFALSKTAGSTAMGPV